MRTSQSYLTPGEVIAVLKAAKERCARDWAVVLLAYCHGMRASEVCNVRLDDIDLKRQAITARRLKGSPDTVQPLYPIVACHCSTSWRGFAHISVIVTPIA